MKDRIKWGILGTGNIAHVFARAMKRSCSSELYAVSSRSESNALDFGSLYEIPKAYSSYDLLLSDPEVDAVYIALPHSMHAEWAIKAAQAKKHILCEKPLTINYMEALSVVKAVKENHVFLMEAFVFRDHPQTEKLKSLIKEGVVGNIRLIDAIFSFRSLVDEKNSLSMKKLGAGSILDVGCYTLSMARLVVETFLGTEFIEPDEIVGVSYKGDAEIDLCSIGSVKFPQGILAKIACGISVAQDNYVKIFGENGSILIKSPWIPGGRNSSVTEILVHNVTDGGYEAISLENNKDPCNYMVDSFVRLLSDEKSWFSYAEEALINMKTLDRWRMSARVSYDCDSSFLA